MRRSKLTINWQLPIGLMKFLTPIFMFGGIGLTIGSLIGISITSTTLAITIIMILHRKAGLLWIPMFKALAMEIVLLVIAAVMVLIGNQWAWLP